MQDSYGFSTAELNQIVLFRSKEIMDEIAGQTQEG